MRPFIVKNALSDQTLNIIKKLDKKWKKAGLFAHTSDGEPIASYGKGRRTWSIRVTDPEIFKELQELFKKYPSKINLNPENMTSNILEYREEDIGCMVEHQDVYYDDTDVRKLSMTIQLSDSNDFEGGQFAIMGEQIPMEKNQAVIFPSFLPHEVHPVTKGKRTVIIAWALGPLWE
jgi:hypothetical protein